MSTHENPTAVDRLLRAIEAGEPVSCDVFAIEACFDATVPNWRFSRRGAAAICEELSRWYQDPGAFEELSRLPVPGGELVEFTLTWQEQGVPHACHQAHLLLIEDDRVARHTVFCGGRWPASLLAEMAEAERVGAP